MVPVWTGSTDTGIGVWAESSLTGDRPTALANGTTDFSLESVAAADPDVIIAVDNAIDENHYEQLSGIAPTVLHAADQTDWVLPWQDVTTRVGAAVGLPEKAAKLVADTEAGVTRARADNPQFEGKSAVLITVRPDGSLRAFSPDAARFQLLTQLGFVPPAQLRTTSRTARCPSM
ncbi:ABC transporter substrate-binding protein [Tomitella biformata]|uniref:ABC transporter substrate-binding protein n=1 Tax=Tomitella biformata TaxID=630403 RepID=UPI001F3D8C88|nr:ABC transporter substrate-binding protein [Tomitella biformata]